MSFGALYMSSCLFVVESGPLILIGWHNLWYDLFSLHIHSLAFQFHVSVSCQLLVVNELIWSRSGLAVFSFPYSDTSCINAFVLIIIWLSHSLLARPPITNGTAL